jgi:hypothetical protein
MALAAADQLGERGSHRVTDLQLHQPVLISDGRTATLQAVLDRRCEGACRLRVYNRVGSSWALSASATVTGLRVDNEIRSDVFCGQ